MADHKKDNKAAGAAAGAAAGTAAGAAPASGGSFLGKLIVAMFMGGVILLEMVLAYLWIPSADHVATLAQERIAEKMLANKHDGDEDAAVDKDGKKIVEVDIGDFDVTAHQPAANSTVRISFHLYATVKDADKSEFESLKSAHAHRLRDRIIFEIRNAEVTDITDPGLGLIKRRILEKSNALFGKPLLRSVMFSDFAFVEQ